MACAAAWTAQPQARAQELPCAVDDVLSVAAAQLLLEGQAPSSANLVTEVREAGSDAVLVHALFTPTQDDAAAAAWLVALRRKSDAELVCGEARSDHGRLLIASARAGTLAPLTAASSVVRGSLGPGFARAELVIADADGKLTRLGLEPSMLEDGVPLAEDLARPATVQLLAHGPAGPRPVAERVLPSAGRQRPATAVGLSPAARGDERIDMLALLAELRRDHGQSALRPNRLLSEVASQHANEVCKQERLAHELSPGRDPEVRLGEAGVRARLVGETISRAGDARTAFDQFADSPSHLLTLLEPRFTDAGVGRATDVEGRTCAVVLLAAWPRYVGR